MKKKHLIILAALAICCLSGCHKDKPVETQAPLETIAPETKSESTGDKLDETSADIEISPIKNYTVTPDGKVLSGEEADEYVQKEILGLDAESDSDSTESSGSENESVAEAETENETLSEEQIAADQQDFTPEEYEQMQKEIDDWTYQEALKRMGIQ